MKLHLLLFIPFSIFAGEALPEPKFPETGYPQYQSAQRGLAQDWHDKMHDRGVDISSSYYVEFAGNPVGGQEHGFGNAASWNTGLGLDFDRIIGIPGLSLYTSCCFRSGVNLSARKINNQYEVTELYGGETMRLTELYLEETLFNGDFHIKAGRLTAGNDYLASPFYCLFTNLAICGNPIAILYNTPFLVFPFSTWGAYADYSPREDFLFKLAVYNNNPDIKQNKYHGCNFTFKSTAGVTWLTEWAYHLNQRKKDKGYHGNYRVGGFFQTGKIAKFEGGSQAGNYGLYFLFDQMLYRKHGPGTTQGLSFFGSFLYSPPNRSPFPYYFDMGLVYKGIIPSRPKDYLNFGVAYGKYSSDLRHEEENNKRLGITGLIGNQPQTSETILELNYWIRCSDWFAITPDLQYVITPKGYGTIPNAFVLQVQLSLDIIGVPKQP